MVFKKKRPERIPSHPGEILKNLWLDELGYSQSEFADKLVKVTPKKIAKSTMLTKLNELVNGRRSISAEFAVLISRVLGTSPKMWMNLQTNRDIWEAEEKVDAAYGLEMNLIRDHHLKFGRLALLSILFARFCHG